jgi:hypothetical protein
MAINYFVSSIEKKYIPRLFSIDNVIGWRVIEIL